MENCCNTNLLSQTKEVLCPKCFQKGKKVNLITLKALLQPAALTKLDSKKNYDFCSTQNCNVVYFTDKEVFITDDLKEPVYQKDEALYVPVCYCFGWTRERLAQATKQGEHPSEYISHQVKEGRCGCEVNNPQGGCCLGNVNTFIKTIAREKEELT